jgi:hypothetical protein
MMSGEHPPTHTSSSMCAPFSSSLPTGDVDTELPALLAGFVAPAPPSGGGGGSSDGGSLNNWRVAVLSAGCAVAGLVLLSVLAGWLYVRHRRHKKRQAAADEEGMKGVITLAGAPAGPEGGSMPGTGSPYDKSGRTTPASQQVGCCPEFSTQHAV